MTETEALFRMPEMVARFRAKVRVDESGCHVWTGALYGTGGYGCLMYARPGQRPRQGRIRAHRFALAMKLDRWPDPCALHSCDNRLCVNPDHLREGTKQENTRDMIERGRSRLIPFVSGPKPHERGPRVHMRKITPEIVASVVAAIEAGETRLAICARMNLSRAGLYKRLREIGR